METRGLLVSICLVMAGSLLPWGICPADAGSGNGSFFANSPAGKYRTVFSPISSNSGTPLRKFVDSLPGLGSANSNNLGQYIPIAAPNTTTFPGSDYYEVGVQDYTAKMHSDLPKSTRLRGYYQINTADPAVAASQYLGPMIVARKGRPVRIRFVNNLGTGAAGNLFIPLDTTVMGAGLGPLGAAAGNYTENLAGIHLHGGFPPWISDGTTHQWTVPAGPTRRG